MISRKCVLVLSMCLAAVGGAARAQWTVVAPNALIPSLRYGAMYFKDGVLWAGWSNLLRSTDSGKTWVNIDFPGQVIYDICFADKSTGIIATNVTPFITHDGGETWTALPNALNLASRVAFGASSQVLYALQWQMNLLRSLDGGTNWQALPTQTTANMTFATSANGALCLVSNLASPGVVSLSSDSGSSWHQAPSAVGQDCWTAVADPGDADRFYLTEESTGNTRPVHLYASLDGGNTWKIGYTDLDVAGSLSVGGCSAFAGTEKHGILRSTDFGASWQRIGGPNGENDNRMVCAINGNIVFAVDSFGNIWATYNGGSDSIPLTKNGALTASPPALFNEDTVVCSDSVSRTLFFIRNGCYPPSIEQCSITGPDSASYRITSSDYDSVRVLFHPVHADASHAMLLIALDDSSIDTVPLLGWNSVGPTTFGSVPNNLFSGDTLPCDSTVAALSRYSSSGCIPPQIINYFIQGTDSACYQISEARNDSFEVRFTPQHAGAHGAKLLLLLSNGMTDTIALGGSGLMGLPLTLATSDEATTTIGGEVSVPITISGLAKPEDVQVILHYRGDVLYDGSYDRNNTKLDVPGEAWFGRSMLQLKQVIPSSIAGHAQFSVFADSDAKPIVSFDSIRVLSASPCEYHEAPAVTASITPPSGCGDRILSEVIQGKAPAFRIRPNPTTGSVMLESDLGVDSATVQVFDALGIERRRAELSFVAGHSVPFSLPADAGIYYVRIETQSGIFSTPVILTR